MRDLIIVLLFLQLIACNNQSTNGSNVKKESTPIVDITYVDEYPHDTNSFTEGLLFHEGKLFESTGAADLPQTRSLFGEVDLQTGLIDVKAELDREMYFGEGITFLDNRVYQLTYKSQTGFVYDTKTYQKTREFTIPRKEGWGLTTDSTLLIMSDGTNQLTFLDPISFSVVKMISVTENHVALENLNELEYVDGFIYANVWKTNQIVKINIANGYVVGRLDLTPFANDAKNTFQNSLEMNGIAYNPVRESFFITGKFWPKIYEFKIRM